MKKNINYFFIFLLLFLLFSSLAIDQRKRMNWRFYGDEGSYFAITQSLAYDFDLKYTRNDIIRIYERFERGPEGLFLKKGPKGELSYAKSFAYPLFAAPFFRIFDVSGLFLFNGLMMFLTILMGYLLLNQYHPPGKSLAFTLIFILATVLPVYMSWLTSDLFNFFIIFAGLFFFFYHFKRPEWFYLSAFFFATAVFSKATPVIPIGILYLILLFRKQWKKFLILTFISILICAGYFMFNFLQTGDFNFMGGERRSFYQQFPFEKPGYGFSHGQKMSTDDYWQRFYFTPQITITNLFYYFFGRFTGMFIYFFSAFFILILFFFQRKVIDDWIILVAIFLSILVFTILAPDNYFGGSGSVGNRYFLIILPFFFFLGFKNRIFKFFLVPLVVALILLPSVLLYSLHRPDPCRYAGLSFPIRLFPAEKTQFLNLQTNENPFAFHNFIRVGDQKYWLFFINDNFWPIETTPKERNSFWTYADKELEMIIAVPGKVKEFDIELTNIPEKNKIKLQIEYAKREVTLAPNEKRIVRFKGIRTLKIQNRYIFLIKIKSEKSYCYYLNDSQSNDRRIVGVKTHIRLDY
ncbi:MAG: hypothetical protein KAS65_07235 [Candidatus Aminicenantes bacterium]|nr:hypothetical protein [Candidatus Aminicenantes bacterium]